MSIYPFVLSNNPSFDSLCFVFQNSNSKFPKNLSNCCSGKFAIFENTELVLNAPPCYSIKPNFATPSFFPIDISPFVTMCKFYASTYDPRFIGPSIAFKKQSSALILRDYRMLSLPVVTSLISLLRSLLSPGLCPSMLPSVSRSKLKSCGTFKQKLTSLFA